MKLSHFISIVIPTSDRSDFLSICCRTLYTQIKNVNDIEVFIVDDGSTPACSIENKSICSDYNFSYIYQKKAGPAAARNTGIKASTGEWIIFLDDDVVVDTLWVKNIRDTLVNLPQSVIGLEGLVKGSGNGIWDREVQNLSGGAYLTCHLAVRASVINKIGGFDETFGKFGPYGEDHELACRLLKQGQIIFNPDIIAVHLPRKIKYLKYIFYAPRRIYGSICSEKYFYSKHPDQYHLFRYSNTFWGTYRNILFNNLLKTLKRRTLRRLLDNPLQLITLIIAALAEQISAWFLIIPIVLQQIIILNKKQPQT